MLITHLVKQLNKKYKVDKMSQRLYNDPHNKRKQSRT